MTSFFHERRLVCFSLFDSYACQLHKLTLFTTDLPHLCAPLQNSQIVHQDSLSFYGVVWLADCIDEVANHLIGCHFSKEALSKKRLNLQGLAYLTSLKRTEIKCGHATGIAICRERFNLEEI